MKKTSYWNISIQRTRTGCKVWNTLEENAKWCYLLNGDSTLTVDGKVTILVGEDCVLMEKGGEEQLLNI